MQYNRNTILIFFCCSFSTENRCIRHDSLQISNEGRRMAVVADQLQAGLQKLETRFRAQYSSTSHVSFSVTFSAETSGQRYN